MVNSIFDRFFGVLSAVMVLLSLCTKAPEDRLFVLAVGLVFAVWQNTLSRRSEER